MSGDNNQRVMLIEDESKVEQAASKSKKETSISREVRRKVERIESEARKKVMAIGEKFQSFLIESDVINEEVIQEKISLFDKQWRFYCRVNHLNDVALPIVSKHLQLILEEFNKIQP